MKHSRNNILLIITDQERAPGPYEQESMRWFREQHLPVRKQLHAEGLTFVEHRITTSACVPSRAVMFTGYRGDITQVKRTDGFAKLHDDADLNWLDPNRVPTLGHRLAAAGFQTPYVGKWHLSHPTVPGDDADPDVWRKADALRPWGFSNWIGPEPHGAELGNSGMFRDPGYVRQASKWLREYARRQRDTAPFLLTVSLVNPHDLVFWPLWGIARPDLLDLDGIPEIGPARSEGADAYGLPGEPSVLGAYRDRYPSAYGPASVVRWIYRRHPSRYRRFYASLLRRTDRQIGALLQVLQNTGLADTTTVVWTADHGEQLGAHGLHQKWYNAFEETVRVPMVIRGPGVEDRCGDRVEATSSHIDLLPTILSIAGVSVNMGTHESGRFERCPVLEGRDLLGKEGEQPIFFETCDHVLEGEHREAALGRILGPLGAVPLFRYPSMDATNIVVESIVARAQAGKLWKLVRYRPEESDVLRSRDGDDRDEYSLFCLDDDPNELQDLYGQRAGGPWCEELRHVLRRRGR